MTWSRFECVVISDHIESASGLVLLSDAPSIRSLYHEWELNKHSSGGVEMYVLVQHQIIDPKTAFQRGEKLIQGEAAPEGVRNLQFYPSADGDRVTCLWEAPSVDAVQEYVDATLRDSAENICYEVDLEQAFARQPLGLRESAALAG